MVSCVTEGSFWFSPRFVSQSFESHMLKPNIVPLLLFSTAANITYSVLSHLEGPGTFYHSGGR